MEPELPLSGLEAAPLEPPPPPHTPERDPFWSYRDAAILAGLSLPCLLAAALLVRAVLYLAHVPVEKKALELLPAQFLGYGFLFVALYLLFQVQYGKPFWHSLGFRGLPYPAGALLLGGILLAVAISLLGGLLQTPDTDNPMKELLKDKISVAVVALFGVTLGPLTEEMLFRGFLQPLFVRSFGAIAGVLAAAVPFGLLHLDQYGWSWRHGLLVTLAGVAFGFVRHRTGSTGAAALMHAGYNLTFFAGLASQWKTLP